MKAEDDLLWGAPVEAKRDPLSGPVVFGLLLVGALSGALSLTGDHPWGRIVLLVALLLSLPATWRVSRWGSATWGILVGLVLVLLLGGAALYIQPVSMPIQDVLGLSWLIGLVAGFNVASEGKSRKERWRLSMIGGLIAWVGAWPFVLIVSIGTLPALRLVILAALAKCILAALGGLLGGLLRAAPEQLWRRWRTAQTPKAASEEPASPTPGLSRRAMLRCLAGIAGLVAAGGGSIAWLFYARRIIYRGHTFSVTAVAWSPDGRRIASASADRTVQIWDAAAGTRVLTYHGSYSMDAVAWSPDGKRMVSGNIGKVQVWDAATGSHVVTLNTDVFIVSQVAWSPDGKRIAAAGNDTAGVPVWDANTGATLLTYSGHNDNEYTPVLVFALAWSPDGKRLASGDENGIVHVWEVASGQTLVTYKGHVYSDRAYSVTSLVWSPDGQQIASASGDNTVQVWGAQSGAAILTYSGHSGRRFSDGEDVTGVNTVAWSPAGNQIASGGVDETVKVWDAATGATNFTYFGHADGVVAVAWSPDGSHVASGSNDRTVQVWQAG